MKTLTVALLVGILALVPVLAAAQSSGGTGGKQAPGSSSPSDKSGGKGAPSGGQGTMPGASGSSPAASPPGTGGTPLQFRTKADCEGAGGAWTEATKTCKRK